MDKQTVWLSMFNAALSGLLAAEAEGFSYPHKSDAVSTAGKVADFGLHEYAKRFGMPAATVKP
jgi:hypothetical protein